jgi:hypothetical protein
VREIPTLIDKLASIYTAPPWVEERERARGEYDALRGRVFEDDAIFESHLRSFLEWYVLERPLAEGETPVVLALRDETTSPAERPALRSLALSHRSLFEVVDVFQSELLLADLILGGLWRIDQEDRLDGIDPGDLFEARLLPWEGRVRFGPAFCFHPRSARESIHAILRRTEEAGQLGPGLVFALATMRLKHDRFRNIAVEHIYNERWRQPEEGES